MKTCRETLLAVFVALAGLAAVQAHGQTISQIIDAAGDQAGNILWSPRRLAVDQSDSVYVTNFYGQGVFRVDLDGSIIEIIDSTGDGAGHTLDRPSDVVVDSAGNVYVSGYGSSNAFKITPSGVITQIIDSTGDGAGNPLSGPKGIAVDSSGNVYTTGGALAKAFKITPGGVITPILYWSGDGAGNTCVGPNDVAVDASGNVFVACLSTSNAFKITPGGVVTQILDAAGNGTLGGTFEHAIAIDTDGSGNVFVAGTGTNNVFRVTPGGTITQVMTATGDGAGHSCSQPSDLAADNNGNVCVTCEGTDNAFKIAPGGVITQIIDGTGDGMGSILENPYGIAVADSGIIYVSGADSDNAFSIEFPIFVDAAATGANDGSSWEDAFTDLKDALEAATSGDRIRVAGGTYRPDRGTGNRTASFQLIGGVVVYGGYRGCPGGICGGGDPNERDLDLYESILTGDLNGDDWPDYTNNGDNSYHVVNGSGTNESAVLDGFVITGGNADGANSGGGIYIQPGSPTISNCRITGNTAQDGAGIHCQTCSADIIDCTIAGNSAGRYGGGMRVQVTSHPTINGCTISGNVAGQQGGGIFVYDRSDPTITGCTITANQAVGGGGIMCNDQCDAMITACDITENIASGSGGGVLLQNDSDVEFSDTAILGNTAGQHGGGIDCQYAAPEITNCVISGNAANRTQSQDGGGGLWAYDDSTPIYITNTVFNSNTTGAPYGGGAYLSRMNITFTNCTFHNNLTATGNGRALGSNYPGYGGTISVTNSILWDGGNEVYIGDSTSLTVTYSDVEGGTGQPWFGTGSIDADPLFVNPDGPDNIGGNDDDNFRLALCSPAINTGSNSPPGGLPATDLDGNPRIVDATVDMGAFEDQDGAPSVPPSRLYVDADATGANDGTSWTDAYDDLQHALTVAGCFPVEVDEVWVAEGTYTPDQGSGDREATFQLANTVSIYGGFAGTETALSERDWETYKTILSGDLVGDDSVSPGPGGGTPGDTCAEAGAISDGETLFDTTGATNDVGVPCAVGAGIWYVYTASHTGRLAVSLCGSSYDTYLAVYEGGACPPLTTLGCNDDVCGSQSKLTVSVVEGSDYFIRVGGDHNETGTGVINISYSIIGANSYSVVTSDGNDATAVLDGFTISDGSGYWGGGMYNDHSSSPTLANCKFANNHAHSGGGAVYNKYQNSPIFTGCTFTGNSADDGGAMYDGMSSSPTLTDCTFANNHAHSGGGAVYNQYDNGPALTDCTFSGNWASHGGAIYNGMSSSPTLSTCTFTGNSANGGGGMYNDDSDPTVNNCTFSENSAGDGGGMYNWIGSSPTLTNCTFTGNSADYGGGGMYNDGSSGLALTNCTFSENSANGGGGMYNQFCSPTLSTCTFSGNSADDYGGGMYNFISSSPALINCTFSGNSAQGGGGIGNWGNSSPSLVNCTLSGNSAQGGGGMRNWWSSSPSLVNCILWSNTPDELVNDDPAEDTPTVSFSDVQGGLSEGTVDGGGNIDADPLFVDADGPDDIPGTEDDDLHLALCSPAVNAGTNTPPGGLPATDLDGNPRVVGGTVDMGVYEYQIVEPDADGDGVPDGCDVCQGDDASGDTDGDGVCDDIDLCPNDNPDDTDGDGVCDSVDVCPGFDDNADDDGDGVPDGCDVCPGGDDTVDTNENGIPDDCDVAAPVLPPAPHDILKNRYVSIDPRGASGGNLGKNFDIRVTLTASLVPGVTAIGSSWFAGPPDARCISEVTTAPGTAPNWDACPTLHLTGCPIIPTSDYDIEVVGGGVLAAQTQALPTGSPGKSWGDVVGSFDPVADKWTPPDGLVSINDAVAAIKTFQNPSLVGPGCGTPPCNATHVSVTDVHPAGFPLQPWGTPNQVVDINDVFAIILGFQGNAFPGPQLGNCP